MEVFRFSYGCLEDGLDAVSPWRHGKGRLGFTQGMVWFHAVSIGKS